MRIKTVNIFGDMCGHKQLLCFGDNLYIEVQLGPEWVF